MVAITSITEQASTSTSHVLGVVSSAARRMPLSTLGASVGHLQTGTGAVNRSVQAKLNEWVSMVDFYLTADGSNYSPALGRALAAHDYVLIPAGTRTFSTVVDLGANKVVRGPGSLFASSTGGARCVANAGMFINPTTTRRRWEIYGLYIEGNNTANIAAIDGPFGGLVHECKIEDFVIGIRNPDAFLSDYDRCSFTGTGTRAISLATTHGCSVTRCHFDAGWATHVTNLVETPIGGGANNGGAFFIFRGNHNASSNTNTNNSLIHVSGNCVIMNNYFEDFSPTGVPSGCKFVHIYVNPNGDFGLQVVNNEFGGSGEASNAVYIEGAAGASASNDCGGIIGYNRCLGFDNATRPAINFDNFNIPFLRVEGNLPRTISIANRSAFSMFKPVCRGTWSNTQAIAGATWVTLNIDGVEEIDISSAMISVADTFRARRVGYYRISCIAKMQSTASSYPGIGLRIMKNGVQEAITTDSLSFISNPTTRSVQIEAIVLCAENDDITVQANNGQNCIGGIFNAEWLTADGHSS